MHDTLTALAALLLIGGCAESPGDHRPPTDGEVLSDHGGTPMMDGAPDADSGGGGDATSVSPDLSEDLPPSGSCTKDAHCQDAQKPLCAAGACVACGSATSHAASFIDEDVPDGTSFKPGAPFSKRWGIKNSGASTWSGACGFSFSRQSGPALGASASAKPADLERVKPGDTRDWKIAMRAPATPGSYTAYWRMTRGATPFGTKVWVTIKVSKCVSDADCLDPAQTICQPDGSCAPPPCASDADCADPAKPRCTTSGCAQCKSSADCPAASPSCQQGSCVDPASCGNGPKPKLGQTAWPIPNKKTICQAFGNKISYQTCGFHTGIDVCTKTGDPLLAIAPGKVVHVGYMWYNTASSGRGPHAVIIQHAPGFYSTYGHNDKALVQQGDCVTKGQKIAEVGNLGYSFGAHLHFELLDGATFSGSWKVPFANACSHYVDPMKYIAP